MSGCPTRTCFATPRPRACWRRRASALAELEQTEAVELFQKQLALLKKRLLSDPKSLRSTFVSDGVQAIAWEFQQEELGADFTKALWNCSCATTR